jgi:hypothetical protein
MPLSKSAISALCGDITDVGWRRCWRDRWGVGAANGSGATVGGASAAGDFLAIKATHAAFLESLIGDP